MFSECSEINILVGDASF